MSRFARTRGSISNIVEIFIPDNSVTTGAGVSGLSSASAISIGYKREKDATFTIYTGANIEGLAGGGAIGTFANPSANTKIRFIEVDATNAKGLYQLMFHDTSTSFGAADTSQSIIVNIIDTGTALKIGPNMVLIPLVPYNPQDAVRMGLTALIDIAITTGAVATDVGNSTTAFKTTLASAVTDFWKDCLLLITSGALLGQVKRITGYNGSTKVITVIDGFTATPADSVSFVLINR